MEGVVALARMRKEGEKVSAIRPYVTARRRKVS
jgi:F0F1-type ATP synthase gamma subunit